MTVQDYFANNAVNVGEKTEPGSGSHEVIRGVGATAILVADDDGSTYLLLKDVPSSFVPVLSTLMCDAITGGTDYDIGVYDSETGIVVDKDLFVDGQTLAAASKVLDGLSAVDIADTGALKSIAELLGLNPTTTKPRYDIVLTANTAGATAGDVVYILEGLAA